MTLRYVILLQILANRFLQKFLFAGFRSLNMSYMCCLTRDAASYLRNVRNYLRFGKKQQQPLVRRSK